MSAPIIVGDCALYHGDCEVLLPVIGKFDAVITDPPYGINEAGGKNKSRGTSTAKWKRGKVKDYGNDDWDKKPISQSLMTQVMAAGKWNIIFGGNYYTMPPSSCWLIWDKLNSGDFADCELAWTNLPKAVRRIQYLWNGFARANNEPRGDHPTQKPLGVMRWCIDQLPADVETILDPFMGSGTTGVAAVNRGRKFIGVEREKKYFDIACHRIGEAYQQPDMLVSAGIFAPVQMDMFEAVCP